MLAEKTVCFAHPSRKALGKASCVFNSIALRTVDDRAPLELFRAAGGTKIGINARELLDELCRGELQLWQGRRVGERFADFQSFHFAPVPEKSIVADFHEAVRQDMHKEPPDKFLGRNGHYFPLAAILVILPLESDAPAVNAQNPAVGDGYPVGVATEIIHNAGCVLKRRFAVNKPLFCVE